MSDVSVTAASVVPGSGATTSVATAGATITAGQAIYLDGSNLAQKAVANGSSAVAAVKGIALNGGAAGQPITYQTAGPLTAGATLTKGTTYVVSASAAGGIAPQADLASTNFLSILGYATSTTVLQLGLNATGVAL